MTDTYQAVYDAVRSKLTGCDIASAVQEAVSLNFSGASYLWGNAQQEIYAVANAMQRPSVLYRPSVERDGDKWCALYGANLMQGVCGYGDTPAEAMADFDINWATQKAARK